MDSARTQGKRGTHNGVFLNPCSLLRLGPDETRGDAWLVQSSLDCLSSPDAVPVSLGSLSEFQEPPGSLLLIDKAADSASSLGISVLNCCVYL